MPRTNGGIDFHLELKILSPGIFSKCFLIKEKRSVLQCNTDPDINFLCYY